MARTQRSGSDGNGPLSGKTAIVTGASSGIGRQTALTLAGAGAAVVVAARRQERLKEIVHAVQGQGQKALAVAADASVQADIDRILESALSWKDGGGKYDIVVVNAGRGLAGSLLASDLSGWKELYDLNVLGAAYLMRKAGQYMVSRKSGDIVAIGSVVGRNISPFSSFSLWLTIVEWVRTAGLCASAKHVFFWRNAINYATY